MRKTIDNGAVPAGGHYSPAIVANGLVFVSGQGPVEPETGRIPDGFTAQVQQTLRNLQTVLRHAGADLGDLVKIGAYIADVTRFGEFDAAYRAFFPDSAPARTTVGAQLIGIQVEIDGIAVLPDASP